MNENDLVGSYELVKARALVDDEESEFKEEFVYDGKAAGTILFNSKSKTNAVFKDLSGNYKKITEIKPEDKKEGDKKEGDKKEEKKEEKKKEDDKKEEEKK